MSHLRRSPCSRRLAQRFGSEHAVLGKRQRQRCHDRLRVGAHPRQGVNAHRLVTIESHCSGSIQRNLSVPPYPYDRARDLSAVNVRADCSHHVASCHISIPAHGDLDISTQLMVQLAALIAGQAASECRVMLGDALTNGVPPAEAKQIVLPGRRLCGLDTVYDFLHIIRSPS